jgi:murein DD-endopeptidase MepM/ murein hydrolase activator NlpD
MKRAFQVSITLALAAFLLLPMPGRGSDLNHRIRVVKGKIAQKRHHEAVLTTTISSFNNRIRGLQGQIRSLQQRQNNLQETLVQKQHELAKTQNQLEKARNRLANLKVFLRQAEKTLAQRLVEMYKDGEPDVLTVILDSNGFSDLLERADFLQRITDQDNQIITRVRTLKAAATKQAKQLGVLQKREADATRAIQQRRDAVAEVKGRLVSTRSDLQGTRDDRRSVLARVVSSRKELEGNLSKLQAQVEAQIRAAQPSLGGGPIRRGSGRLIWPVNGPITSPFCERRPWEACHPGIDIGVPSGTPIHAADSGRVIIAGWESGYGNYTCIQHTASLSTCYGHQSAIYVHVGQNVSQAQVIGLTGCTGLCFGPHLHFEVRINGSVVNPLNYL